jgi:L-rhamnose mutarotase
MKSIRIKRYCKILQLHPDPEIIRQYKALHAKGAVWPEITQGMKEVGILDMEIYNGNLWREYINWMIKIIRE